MKYTIVLKNGNVTGKDKETETFIIENVECEVYIIFANGIKYSIKIDDDFTTGINHGFVPLDNVLYVKLNTNNNIELYHTDSVNL